MMQSTQSIPNIQNASALSQPSTLTIGERAAASGQGSQSDQFDQPTDSPGGSTIPPARPPLDLQPGCVYGVVTRERVDELTIELREIKARLNQLFSLVVGAIFVDVLLRIGGFG